ncbi:MAG TPA: FAD-dependent oxidoreductase [Acidobacteriaceae bacterium]|jgi:NADPH-dependent 2,4-dienoyl-CoA reductase/sulfur reductase-like enzyme/nitrite reductase/ring-hydroxylating ferredoxin subunit
MATNDAGQEMNFDQGIPVAKIPEGKMVSGNFGDKPLLVVHQQGQFFAIDAHCTHYGGNLADGLLVGDTVRCPLHHACFSLRTGEALRAPALDALNCWKVEKVDETLFIRDKVAAEAHKPPAQTPQSVTIVGGGGAGLAAADMLRREGYEGGITMISADSYAPCDRPNLSKDYLAGTAGEDWLPLRPADFYTRNNIESLLNSNVASIDPKAKEIHLENGSTYAFDALLLATGAKPVELKVPGAEGEKVLYLRSFADSRAIIAKTAGAKSVVVAGASFIGLEVAASLRTREIEVHVVAPGKQPLEHVLGSELGAAVRKLHEAHGVHFHLGKKIGGMEGTTVTLSDGSSLQADFVVAGVGVRPSVTLAEQAGLAIDRGVLVNEYMETSVPSIFAAGDIARWPDPHSRENIRVEHWVVAERQGQTAARNILGKKVPFHAVPFFWSQHYDKTINYVGHAEHWDSIVIDGDLDKLDCTIKFHAGGRIAAVASIGRDLENLKAEEALERESVVQA